MASIETIAKELTTKAEEMELDQRLVTEFMVKYDRSDIIEAMDTINWEERLKDYSDKTLNRMNGSGTNLQFNTALRRRMYNHMLREISRRSKDTKKPKGHGMGAKGGQK